MFENIGGKIKVLAKLSTWIGIAVSIMLGIVLIASEEEFLIIIGIVVAVLGSLLSWLGSFLLYAVGQITQNTDIIAGRINLKDITDDDDTYQKNQRQVYQNRAVQNEAKKPQIKKTVSNYSTAPSSSDEMLDSRDEYVDVYCPHCGEELSFTYSEFRSGKPVPCPHCSGNIDLNIFIK